MTTLLTRIEVLDLEAAKRLKKTLSKATVGYEFSIIWDKDKIFIEMSLSTDLP